MLYLIVCRHGVTEVISAEAKKLNPAWGQLEKKLDGLLSADLSGPRPDETALPQVVLPEGDGNDIN